MHGKVVLLSTADARIFRQVSAALVGAGNRVVQATSAAKGRELLEAAAVDLLVADWDAPEVSSPLVEAAAGRIPVVALGGEQRRDALRTLICDHGVFHVCSAQASGTRYDPAELVTTCEKILRGQSFGLDKYLAGFGVELRNHILVRADERDDVVGRLVALVKVLGGGRRVAESVGLVADELITNATYNAPRRADGSARYAHVSRREKITLDPTEYVRVEYGSDGRTFGLAVTDNFGALHPSTLQDGVRRCFADGDQIEQKAGGAGIGLYTALGQANQLVINLAPGARTEVIALWELERRGRGAGAAAGSFHLFTHDATSIGVRIEPAARQQINLLGIPERNVALSDSVRREVFATVAGDAPTVSLSVPGQSLAQLRPSAFDRADTGKFVSQTADTTRIVVEPSEPRAQSIGDLSALHHVQLLRRTKAASFESILSAIEGARHIGDAMEAALTHLVGEFDAAALFCRIGGQLVAWTGAGDIDSWDTLAELALPLPVALVAEGSVPPPIAQATQIPGGWLGQTLHEVGVGVGALGDDGPTRVLGALMIGQDAGEGVSLSLGLDGEVHFVLLGCRSSAGSTSAIGPAAERADSRERFQRLHRALAAMVSRIASQVRYSDDSAELGTAEPRSQMA